MTKDASELFDWDDNDFCPADASHDVLYMGTRKYIAADTINALTAERDALRAALTDLVSWFDGGPSSYGPWIIRAGEDGADDAVKAARGARDAALNNSTTPEKTAV